MKFSGQCPVCGAALHLARLSCPGCKAEFPTDEPLSPYECLSYTINIQHLLSLVKLLNTRRIHRNVRL